MKTFPRRLGAMIAAAALTVPLLAALSTVAAAPAAAATSMPGVYQTKIIGYSVQHRPIVAYHMGDPTAKTKALLTGQIHGDEHAGITVANTILHGPAILGIDLWVIPTVNPDGNALNTRQNAHHVDLNRNWPNYWQHLTGQYYSGSAPLSEPETRAMYTFLTQFKPTLFVSIHQPLDGVDTTDGGARSPAFARKLATGLGLPLKALVCWGFCHGSMTGWVTHYQKGVADTVEFGWHPTRHELTAVAPKAILTAFGAHYGTRASHNPTVRIQQIHAIGNIVTMSGYTFDVDAKSTSTALALLDNGRTIWAGHASGTSTAVDKAYRLSGRHGYTFRFYARNGIHTYCVRAANILTGTTNPSACYKITVDGTATGHYDTATVVNGTVHLTGWAYDPDAGAAPVKVQVREGLKVIGTYTANVARPDVNKARKVTGNHGFAITLPAATDGNHTYTVYAVNAGSSYSPALVSLGSKTVTVHNNPVGSATVTTGVGTLTVSGWTYDPNSAAASTSVRVTVNWTAGTYSANLPSPDIDTAQGIAGNHGFAVTLPEAAGTYSVTVAAVNAGPGTDTGLGTYPAIVAPAPPVCPSVDPQDQQGTTRTSAC